MKKDLDEETVKQAEYLDEFWKIESTQKKVNDSFIKKYGFEPAHSYKNAGFASVCVNHYRILRVIKRLVGSVIKACVVIGFPLGANKTQVKALESKAGVPGWCR